jgi:hypothetical protein
LKIPKRVNATLDWMGHNVRMVAAVGAALIISILTWSWAPAVAAFVLGVTIGGTIVHRRMAARQAALRSDIDDLLRQNGALRREKLTLASGVLAKQTQLTAKLPVIPEDSPAGGDGGDQPAGEQPAGPAARTDPTAAADSTAPGSEAPANPTTRTQPDGGASAAAVELPVDRTTMLPAVPDDADVPPPAAPADATRADPPKRARRSPKKTSRLPTVPDETDS